MAALLSYLPGNRKSVRILVVGRVNSGKSALINKMLKGPRRALEGVSLSEHPDTRGVQRYSFELGGVTVSVYESPVPRQADESRNGRETRSLTAEEIFRQCDGEVDLLLYCCRLDTSVHALNMDLEFELLDQLLKSADRSLWNHIVFALTFSNRVVESVVGHFTTHIYTFGHKLCECLVIAGLDRDIASSIPLVPVAYRKDDIIPHHDNWYDTFWNVCVNRIREHKGTMDLKKFFIVSMSPDASLSFPSKWKEWLSISKRSVSILVTGKTGTGKSSLINGIVGRVVAPEGHTLNRGTTCVQEYRVNCEGDVTIRVWDSPGLQDGLDNEEEYILDMQRKGCANADLVFYCTKMNSTRMESDDQEAIRKLTKGLGTSFWTNSVFVLTFANDTHPPPSFEYQSLNEMEKAKRDLEFFNKRLTEWEEKLRAAVINVGVNPDVAAKIPVVPTGYETNQSLPGYENWLSNLWLASIERMKEESQAALLMANKDRIKNPDQITPEDLKKPLHAQPILFRPTVMYSIAPTVISIIGAMVGGVMAGPMGATAGVVAGASVGGIVDGMIALLLSKWRSERNPGR